MNTLKIVHFTDVAAEDAEEGASKLQVRWLITKEMGAENFEMRLFEMTAGGHSPYHNHPWEHEVYILEGEGLVVGEDLERPFGTGDVIFIPQNEKHQFKNTGEKTVKFLCIVPTH
ncbi:MAG: cupin domain-containing protein [Candidatus Bathyarchaeota archaeon]|nr:cupin domain-containing protein [Candidatus Bathyarchaeota archaeon]